MSGDKAISSSFLGRGGLLKFILTATSFVLLMMLWEASVRWFDVPPYVLPLPGRVLTALQSGILVPIDSVRGFYIPLAHTLANAGLGFLIGATLGIALGSLMAELRWFETMVMPYAFALQTLPKVALAPLVVIWCGFGDGSKVVMSALLVFFPMMVNTFTGLRTTDPDRIDLMRVLSASRLETYLFVKIPSAAPYIFAGINMGVVYALLGTIVAEFLGAQHGIGVTITQAQSVTDVALVFAILIVLGILGSVLHWTITFIERHVIHWTERKKA